jgi:uncharacterized protein (DUF1330 family)
MSAYWICTYREIIDQEKVTAYAEIATSAIREAGGRFLARGLPELTYESAEQTRTVVIEFESVEAAQRTHDSDEYQRALAALDGGAVRDLRVVPGEE